MGASLENAPQPDLDALLEAVGVAEDTCSEDAELYVEIGGCTEVKPFKGACKAYSEHKSRGSDGWGPKELYSLPDFVLIHFVAFLRRCHRHMRWPHGVLSELHGAATESSGR